jgi:hypothetical protein
MAKSRTNLEKKSCPVAKVTESVISTAMKEDLRIQPSSSMWGSPHSPL